jgi:hypothetical protein
MNRRLIIKRIAIAAVGVALLLAILKQLHEASLCRHKLANVFLNNLVQYRLDHDGHWPPDIISVAAAFPGGDRQETDTNLLLGRLSCPGAGRGASRNGTLQSDYIYMNWELHLGTNAVPINYPLFYDRRLANHFGLGVNVLTANGLFWDFRALRLKKFVAEHPEYHIPLPE